MFSATSITGGRAGAGTTAMGRIIRTLKMAAEEIGRRAEQRRAIARLQTFSNFELSDIGLSRSQIEYAVTFGRPSH